MLASTATCGRIRFDPLSADVAADASADTSVEQRQCTWTGAFTFSEPRLLAALSSADHEQQPHLSSDGLSLYFASARPGGQGGFDLYVSERADHEAQFESIRNLELSTAREETAIALTTNMLIAFVSSNRDLPGADIYEARRALITEPFGTPVLAPELSTAFFDYDPFPVDHGLTLYYMISDWDQGLGGTEIVVSRRPALDEPFEPPVAVPGINTSANEDNPSLTADSLVMVFASNRPGTTGLKGLYYSVRADRQQPFPSPQPIPGLVSEFLDTESFVTPDGCEIYFTSIRTGPQTDIYHATYVGPGT